MNETLKQLSDSVLISILLERSKQINAELSDKKRAELLEAYRNYEEVMLSKLIDKAE